MNVKEWNKEGLKPSYYVAPCPACGKYPYVSKHKDTQGRLYFSVAHYCDPGDHVRAVTGQNASSRDKIAICCERFNQADACDDWNDYAEQWANTRAQLSLF